MLSFSFIISTALFSMWILGKIPIFQKAYADHLQRLEDDTWLQTQCRDPEFFSRMRQHTDVCEHVRASFQQPAILVGLQACIPVDFQDFIPTMEWKTWVVVVIGTLILIPNVLLPLYRANEFKREHIRVLQACSPQIYQHGWDDITIDNHVDGQSRNIMRSSRNLAKNIIHPYF